MLCRTLELSRNRPLTLHSVNLPAMPFGMWYDDGREDHIFYRSSATGYYRDHIVLHEICHMLVGHGTRPAQLTGETVSYLVDGQRLNSRVYGTFEEQLAETFSSMVLKIAGQKRSGGVGAVERRADELFRGAHA
ncbi:hypothetical protein [Sinosporangium siamense]|uniref:IrrE N-terminal-like domain-containing protein n=1 Tax=Sinosporangium siamense TaxID=1367973 RepID=A0A919RMS0_9ACTN|nr:hypothetical protein [Sinosporangium siamense]GII95036.1 hypothetical protein Ssi02_52670 [Sinosporangium siamense]